MDFEPSAHRLGKVESSPERDRRRCKVAHAHSVEIHRNTQWHVRFSAAISIRRDHVDLVSSLGQRPAKAMNRVDRAAISDGGKIGGDDVKESHRESLPASSGCRAEIVLTGPTAKRGMLSAPLERHVAATAPARWGTTAAAICLSWSRARSSSEAVARRHPSVNALNRVRSGSE